MLYRITFLNYYNLLFSEINLFYNILKIIVNVIFFEILFYVIIGKDCLFKIKIFKFNLYLLFQI